MYFNEEHKKIVEERGDRYIYIGSYKYKEITIDGKKSKSHIRVKCPYCEEEYDIRLDHFKNGSKCPNCCHSYENSFAYHIEIELNENLDKYWSDKNILNPYHIYKHTQNKIWIKCQEKDYHNDYGGYLIAPSHFNNGKRCPYCSTHPGKVHKLDSFGTLYPEKAKYWSKSNKKSPYEVTPKSVQKYRFICQKCSKEFERSLENLNRNNIGVICRECSASQLEQCTKEILDKYNIKYKREYFYKDLFGIGNKNLRFDFYLTDYNLLIECQGEQHEKWQKTWQTEEDFEKQLEHDRRKKEYAKQHNIDLLEIWYYDMDNIEDIIINKLNLKEGE